MPDKLDFFSLQWAILIGPLPNEKTLWRLPKMKISLGRWSESPLVHIYRWKDDHFGQSKCGAIRNIWGNTLRTQEPCANLKRTDWEHEKVKKIQHPHPPSPQDKTLGLSNACSIASLSGQKLLFLHLFVTIFKQLVGLLMNQLTGMGDSWLCFVCLFSKMEPCCVFLWVLLL